MNKKLILLAILGACAGSALAQSSVTMYGVLDAGIDYQSPPAGGSGNQFSLSSGISTPSRVGFKGSEDFGGSLKALFQIEAGIQINNGQSYDTGTLFNRASYLGLAGDFGAVMVGRQFTPMYNAVYSIDPFELGMTGNAGNLMHLGGANISGNTLIGGGNPWLENGGGSMQQNNSMRYVSHDYKGFSMEFNYGFGGASGSTSDGSETGYLFNYDQGPVHLVASYDGINATNFSHTFKTVLVGGSINWDEFGVPLKTNFGYQTNKGTDMIGGSNVDSSDLLLGLVVPMGKHEVLFSYIHLDNKDNPGYQANQFALGYKYALSTRTSLYSSIGEITNKNGAEFTLGNASNPGYGVKAFDLGIRHSF